ncbi:hypothetical protein ACH5RR_015024 [Cinchona calisaya]|uniref:Uncharacterized protein n=1 Tax=Cinchona calisaya TaxID=153742 RepID=A0ABD2ZV21_9GENT
MSKGNQIRRDTKVELLIDQTSHRWNTYLIDSVFEKEEAIAMKQIPLGRKWSKDRIVWHYTKNRHFSVKSADHLIMDNDELSKITFGCSGERRNKV